MSRLHVPSMLACAALSAATLFAANPVVTDPVAAKAAPGDPSRDYPFFAAIEDLKARGYVEQEYLFSGTANQYETPLGATGKVIDGNHKYRTRLVFGRPAGAATFNGTVIVEWNSVTSGHDLDIDWYQIHDHLIRSGYAWVGVTPQRISVEALKVWNKDRYGSLDVTDGGATVRTCRRQDPPCWGGNFPHPKPARAGGELPAFESVPRAAADECAPRPAARLAGVEISRLVAQTWRHMPQSGTD
jgi:hypothetical protein